MKSLVLVALIACAHNTPGSKTASLFVRIGGQDALTGIVKALVEDEIPHDARIKDQFKTANIDHFEKSLVEQLCAVTGGPCKYTGQDMKTAHGMLKITHAQFTAFMEDLGKTLDKFHAALKENTELLELLGRLEGDVVAKP